MIYVLWGEACALQQHMHRGQLVIVSYFLSLPRGRVFLVVLLLYVLYASWPMRFQVIPLSLPPLDTGILELQM